MANLGQKNGIYHVRFRFQGTEYKKSLKTRDLNDAQAAVKSVENTIHYITIGQLQVPAGVDPGAFIAHGGKVPGVYGKRRVDRVPPLPDAVNDYLATLQGRLADSYIDSQRTHLKHLQTSLNGSVQPSIPKITFAHLDRFLQARRKVSNASTVAKELNTLRHFFRWCVNRQYVQISPAKALASIPHGREMDRFRTMGEVEQILQREGMTNAEIRAAPLCQHA